LNDQSVLLKQCSDKRFQAFGTGKIFERRVKRLERRRNWITYLGIAVPLLVGSLGLSFGGNWVKYLAVPAGIAAAIQLILSLWSLVARWDDKYVYAVSAMQAQTKLFNSWDFLAKRQPANLEQRIDDLAAEDQRQETSDIAQGILPEEKRFAMRAALYHYGLVCLACKIQPPSMKASKCDTCGNF